MVKLTRLLLIIAMLLAIGGKSYASKAAVVLSRTATLYEEALKGLKQEAKVEVSLFNMEGNQAKGNQIMKDISAGGYDVAIAIGSEALNVSEELRADIPLVYTMVLNPYEKKRSRTGGVVIKIGIDDQLARLRKIFPERKKIGVIYNPNFSKADIEEARSLVEKYNFSLFPIAVEKQVEISAALSKFTPDTVDIIWMVVDQTVSSPASFQEHIEHSRKNRIPLVGLSLFHVKAGALIGFAADFNDVGMQTGRLAQRIVTKSGSLKVESPKKVLIYLNSKMQKQLDVTLTMLPEIEAVE